MATGFLPITNNRLPMTIYHLPVINHQLPFMQNKPNLPAPQMNVNSVIIKDYENERLH